MEGGNYLIALGDLLARFCLSFVFLWSGVSKAFHPAAGKAEIGRPAKPKSPHSACPIRHYSCRSP
jgi:hypothetical protein